MSTNASQPTTQSHFTTHSEIARLRVGRVHIQQLQLDHFYKRRKRQVWNRQGVA